MCFLLFCVLSLGLFSFLGQDFFPQVDAGLLRLHVRRTRRIAGRRDGSPVRSKSKLSARTEFLQGQLQTILDNIGLPNSGINQSYSSSGTIGTSDAEILIALNPENHPPTADSDAASARVSAADVSRAWSSSSSPPTS